VLNIIASLRPIARNTTDTRRNWEVLATGGAQTVFLPAQDSGLLFVTPHLKELAQHLEMFAATELGAR
jgi:hypothetical protein